MAGLGIRTKRVATYGRKKTGVVTLYHDHDLLTPTKHDSERDWITTFSEPIPSAPTPTKTNKPKSTTTAKRAPLTSKLSNNTINLPPSTPRPVAKKGSKTISVSDDGSDIVFLDKPQSFAAKTKTIRPIIPVVTPARKQVLEGVILQSSKSSQRTASRTMVSVSDITEDVTNLSIEEPTRTHLSTPLVEFDNLVSACTLKDVHDFSTFISSPAVISLLDPEDQALGPSFKKIGEASYSEVYSMGIQKGKNIVIKVIPLVDHGDEITIREDGKELPDTSYPKDVLRELEITQRMGVLEGATSRFVNFLGSYIVKGKYPQVLIDEWWTYKTTAGSSSACPDLFDESQRFALIVLADGGIDLESFQFDSTIGWKQAAGVFWQTADALARAEQWTSFEHRDLHEGQILITPASLRTSNLGSDCLSESDTGIKVTIIDFGLSRLSIPGKTSSTWSDLPPEVYEGKGDQWDVYRSMRDVIGEDWAGFHPETNVLWLQYIVRYLLNRTKPLKKPRQVRPARRTRTNVGRKSDITEPGVMEAYERLKEVEEYLKERNDVNSAGDLVKWGRAKGWIGT